MTKEPIPFANLFVVYFLISNVWFLVNALTTYQHFLSESTKTLNNF